MVAYYNEFDEKAAAWLRELIARGLIADGIVDTRSIEDVRPSDLAGYTQCHFFAGIGVWSYALRQAGWPDDRPVWTGSCPCQPFSAAGKGGGFDDERHLWPAFHWLIQQRRPAVVFGEQVASKDAEPWIDLVQADLEGLDYALGASPYPSAGVGAPHIRDRMFWVADAERFGRERRRSSQQGRGQTFEPTVGSRDAIDMGDTNNKRLEGRRSGSDELAVPQGRQDEERSAGLSGVHGRLADADSRERDGQPELRGAERDGKDAGRPEGSSESGARSVNSGLGYAERLGTGRNVGAGPRTEEGNGGRAQRDDAGSPSSVSGLVEYAGAYGPGAEGEHGLCDLAAPAGPVNGFWRDADWLFCRDGQWRPVEPGSFPLVNGASARVGRLRGYGNAINADAARVFIEAYLEAKG